MKELQNIIIFWNQLKNLSQSAALATLVKTEGSTYRRAGARMLITADGEQIGSISGGCLESDVIERSQKVLQTGNSMLVKYDSTSEDDLIWGLGLGCQGVAYLLIERLNPDEPNVLDAIAPRLATGEIAEIKIRKAVAVATVFQVEGTEAVQSTSVCLLPDGKIISQISNLELAAVVRRDLQTALEQKSSQTKIYELSEGTVEVFLEVIEPPLSLVIFGAGFDVIPVVYFAKQLGWYVTVVDFKARSSSKTRFADADAVILADCEEIEAKITFDERSVAVIMTHNYLYDLEILPILLSKSLAYLGILGPKTRTERLFADLPPEGLPLESRLHTPIGLDLGADNPEEIALAIIAEICAVTRDRQGGFLKHRLAPIHY